MNGIVPNDLQLTNLTVQRNLNCTGKFSVNAVNTANLQVSGETLLNEVDAINIVSGGANLPFPLPFEIPLWNASSSSGLSPDYYIIFDAVADSATYTCNLPTGSRRLALFTDCGAAGNLLNITVGTQQFQVTVPMSKHVTNTDTFVIANSADSTAITLTMAAPYNGNDVTLYGLAVI